jgi:hypothetical protein
MKRKQSKKTLILKIRKLRHVLSLLVDILDSHKKIIDQKNYDFFSDEDSIIFMVETHLNAFLKDDIDANVIIDFVDGYFKQA